MGKLNREKCKCCKYWKESFNDGWSYQMVRWCKNGINNQADIDKCKCHKEKETWEDNVDEVLFNLTFVIMFGLSTWVLMYLSSLA